MAGASIAEKRARWKKLLKGAGFFQASRRLGGKKWRIVENKPRTDWPLRVRERVSLRDFDKGNSHRFQVDPSKADLSWSVHHGTRGVVYTTAHAMYGGAQAAVSS